MNNTITREQAVKMIRATNGKFFSVDFIKSNGELRHMTARLGVKKHLKGGESTIKHKENLIGCFDSVNNGYRCINANTLQQVKIAGVEYQVED